MFYLSNFFKIIIKNPISGLLFIFLSGIFFFFSINLGVIENQLKWGASVEKSGDYFYALLDARENISRVARKISNLPGVARVQEISEEEIESQLNSIFSEIGDELKLEMRYGGLQIVFVQNLERRSQDLIREYLVRLVGREKVTLGVVTKVVSDERENKPANSQFVKKNFVYGVLLVLLIFWEINYYVFSKYLGESAYLIFQYQQKRRVFFKMVIGGLGSTFLALLGISLFFFESVSLYGAVGLMVLIFINAFFKYREATWQN